MKGSLHPLRFLPEVFFFFGFFFQVELSNWQKLVPNFIA